MHGSPGIRILDPFRSPDPDPLSLCQEGINLIVTCFNVVVKIVLKQVTVSSIVYTGRWSSIIDSDTEECFLGDFGTSWNINFQRMSSQVICFWPIWKTTGYRLVPSLSKSYTFQLDPLEVFA